MAASNFSRHWTGSSRFTSLPWDRCWRLLPASELRRFAMQMAVKVPLIILAAALATTGCRHTAQESEPPHERPAAAEIRQKLVGTWLVDLWATKRSADPIVVTFGADGRFESSRNFTKGNFEPSGGFAGPSLLPVINQTYKATWQAKDGYFIVTPTNSLPACNLQIFVVRHLDDQEIVCSNPSTVPPMRFRKR